MASSDSEEDIGGICDHCLKRCQSLHTFLRHVSHSKSCKLSYDQDYLDQLKKKAKVISKRKFYKSLSKNEKKRRYDQEKEWRCKNAKKRYVPKWKFRTEEGRAFENIFKQMFDIASKETETKLEEMAKKVEYLDDISCGETMEFVFSDVLDKMTQTDNDCCNEEEFDYGKLDDILEEKFEEKWKKSRIEEQKCWSAKALADILENLYFSTLNKAYLEYCTDEYKELFKKAEDISMDKVFFNVENVEMEEVPEEHSGSFYHFLDLGISSAVYSTHKKEVNKQCEEIGLKTKILDLIKSQFAAKMKRTKLVKDYI